MRPTSGMSVAGICTVAPADAIAGQAFNCYDQYISEWDVVHLVKELSGSPSVLEGRQTCPKYEIRTGKLRALGMTFGGRELLQTTVEQLVAACAP